MAVLGHVRTDIGRIQLHWDGERFTTVRTYVDFLLPKLRETIVLEPPETALEYYELCEQDGAVFAPFPGVVTA